MLFTKCFQLVYNSCSDCLMLIALGSLIFLLISRLAFKKSVHCELLPYLCYFLSIFFGILFLQELQPFLDLLQNEPLKYQAFFVLAIYGGFRRGEILGIEWKNIDFKGAKEKQNIG